jgi:hypothetical protein
MKQYHHQQPQQRVLKEQLQNISKQLGGLVSKGTRKELLNKTK